MLSKSLFGMIGTPYNALPAAVQAEVACRRTFSMTDALSGQISRMATWLTDDSARFAAVLCGGCGNGKTTLVKAFRNLLCYLNIPVPDSPLPYGRAMTEIYNVFDKSRAESNLFGLCRDEKTNAESEPTLQQNTIYTSNNESDYE